MTGTIIELILILVAHAAAGIYSSTLKYSKKTTYIIWGTWLALQTAFLLYSELVLTNWTLQFFFGFILALVARFVCSGSFAFRYCYIFPSLRLSFVSYSSKEHYNRLDAFDIC